MPPLFAGSKNQKYMQWLFINDNVFRSSGPKAYQVCL